MPATWTLLQRISLHQDQLPGQPELDSSPREIAPVPPQWPEPWAASVPTNLQGAARPDRTRPAGGTWRAGWGPQERCRWRVVGWFLHGVPCECPWTGRSSPWCVLCQAALGCPSSATSARAIPLCPPSQLCSRGPAGIPWPAPGQSRVISYLSRLPSPWGAGCHPTPATQCEAPCPPEPGPIAASPFQRLPAERPHGRLGSLALPVFTSGPQWGCPSVTWADCWGAQSLQPSPPLPPKDERSQGP